MKHLRTILVLLHVLAITLLAFPAPVGLTQRALAQPEIQDTIQADAEALQDLGVDLGPQRLSALLWSAGSRFLAARRTLLAPFRPYARAVGCEQGWRMFGTLNRRPAWLLIELQEGETWRPIYRSRSETLSWHRQWLDQERMRAQVNQFAWLRHRQSYDELGTWLARQAAVEFPQANHIRLSMEQRSIPAPAVLEKDGWPPPTLRWQTVHSLDKFR